MTLNTALNFAIGSSKHIVLQRRKSGTLDGKSYTLLKKYIELIRSGKKTVEGRINKGSFVFAKVGDSISFYTYQGDRISCRITGVNTYSNFREMLKQEGVSNCLPGVVDIEEGVKTYHAIPNYEQNAKKYGVVALKILLEKSFSKKRKNEESDSSQPNKLRKLSD